MFRLAVDLSPSGTIVIDASGRIVLVNREIERLFGYPRSELVGQPVEVLVPAAARETHPRDRGAFLRQPQARPMGAGRNLFGRRKDGSLVAVEIGLNPVVEQGENYVLASVVDVSERRHAEQRFTAAFESSPHGMIMVDAAGAIVMVNREVERLFGYSREELQGQPIELLVPEKLRGRHPGLRAGFMQAPSTRAMGAGRELFGRRKDGKEVPIEIGLNPVDTDQGSYVISSIVDITQRRELENQLLQSQKMEAVGTLAGGIAHDFNNILGAVVGYGELLRSEIDAASTRGEDLEQLLAAAERGRKLVSRIVAFSRRRPEDRSAVDLKTTVSEALHLLRATLPSTIEIRRQFEDATPRVLADPTQMHQVVMNLVTNAAHAMTENGGRLEVSLSPVYADTTLTTLHPGLQLGLHARLRVTDSGAGMAPEIVGRVFEPFFTTKAPGQGSGLGLSVVHGIVRSHGGAVAIRSTRGQGTVVDVYVPASDASSMTTVEAVPPASERVGEGRHVLLVDDETALSTIGRRLLERMGCRVTAFTSSLAALEAVRTAPADFDLVLSDYTMPQMIGTTLAEAIHTIRPDLRVVIMTGYSEGIPPDALVKAGVAAVMDKPVTARALGEMLQRMFEVA